MEMKLIDIIILIFKKTLNEFIYSGILNINRKLSKNSKTIDFLNYYIYPQNLKLNGLL